MRIFKGKVNAEVTESNSLVANMIKEPALSKVLVRLYPQYGLTYLTEGLGRIAKDVQVGNREYRWKVIGRLTEPSTCTGIFSPATNIGQNQSVFKVVFYENYIHPYDVVRFKDGTQAIAISGPKPVAGGYEYEFRLQTDDPTQTLNPANLANGELAGVIGSVFPEGSEKGYSIERYPDEYVNYLTIMRMGKTITGDALTDIIWLENNGQKLWFYEAQQQLMDLFMYRRELMYWYGRRTIDANGNINITDNLGRVLLSGDGLLAQIEPSNIDTYSGQLTDTVLLDFMTQLAYNNGNRENIKWVVYTGTAGMRAFYEAMKNYLTQTGSVFYDYDAGMEIELGLNFKTFHALGHTITVVRNPIFDDPTIHHDIDPATGYPKESYRMVFVDWSVQAGGQANVEIAVKGADRMNRGFIVKYIPGMMDPFNPNSVNAATSFDGFTIELLSESGIVVRNPLACGMLIRV